MNASKKHIFRRLSVLAIALVMLCGMLVPFSVSAEEAEVSPLYMHLDFNTATNGVFTSRGLNQKTYSIADKAHHSPAGIDGGALLVSADLKGHAITESIDFSFNNGTSISMWVRGETPAVGWNGVLVAKGQKSDDGHFEILSSSDAYKLYSPAVGTIDLRFKGTDFAEGWHNLVFSWEDNVIKTYIDGVLKGTSEGIAGSIPASSLPFYFGSLSDETMSFNGLIDEVKLYTKALTEQEALEEAAAFDPLYIEMDVESQVEALIESPEFSFADGEAIQLWFNTAGPFAATKWTTYDYILTRGEVGSTDNFQFFLKDGGLGFYAANPDGTSITLSPAQTKTYFTGYTKGWHLFTVVHKDSQFHIYVDGILLSSVDASAYQPAKSETPWSVAHYYNGYNELLFSGKIAKVELLMTAPTADEIRRTYDSVAHPHEHTLGDWTIGENASCASIGYRYKQCLDATCGAIVEIDKIPATGNHTFGDWTVAAPAEDGKSGLEKRTCACGYSEFRLTDPLQHTHDFSGNSVYAADGHYHACASCGALSEKQDHAFGEWTKAGGLETRACACGYTETRTTGLSDGALIAITAVASAVISCGILLVVLRFVGKKKA